jgi:hypothetical protein
MGNPNVVFPATPTAVTRSDNIRQDIDMGTVRVSYRFGGPVIAKYRSAQPAGSASELKKAGCAPAFFVLMAPHCCHVPPMRNNPLMIREGTGNRAVFFLRSSITPSAPVPGFPAMRALKRRPTRARNCRYG